jgi:hypothetical protein
MNNPDLIGHAYLVELLCKARPNLDRGALLAALQRHCPGARALDDDPVDGLHCVHPDHPVTYAEATLPAQTLFAERDTPLDLRSYEAALRQSWHFPQARERLSGCSAAVVVSDLMATPLERHRRLELFQDCVAAALEVVACEAIFWRPSQLLVAPEVFLADLARPGYPRLFAGAVNVRLFNISGAAGDYVMDTMGLAIFGLPDVQCHFGGLSPNDVGPLLFDTALYLFDKGDVIEDGQTVSGLPREARWRCQHEMALVGPERVVLDISPGAPYAAGRGE